MGLCASRGYLLKLTQFFVLGEGGGGGKSGRGESGLYSLMFRTYIGCNALQSNCKSREYARGEERVSTRQTSVRRGAGKKRRATGRGGGKKMIFWNLCLFTFHLCVPPLI